MGSISEFLNRLLMADTGTLHFGQSFLALGIAYVGGILSSLTPCIYPMIPITIGVIGGMTPPSELPQKHAPARHAFRAIGLRALLYIAGMTAIYSVLGVAAGLTGKIFGSFTNTAGWTLFLGIIMTLSALIMLDIIPFDPQAWWDRWRRHKRHPSHPASTHEEMTHLGAFVLGASSGLIASPCTTPALTVILAFIAKTQSIGLGLGLMISFTLGLSTLLLGIAFFTGALQILPRSGNWLKSVKLASGLLLLAFAEYLIYRAGNLGGL